MELELVCPQEQGGECGSSNCAEFTGFSDGGGLAEHPSPVWQCPQCCLEGAVSSLPPAPKCEMQSPLALKEAR